MISESSAAETSRSTRQSTNFNAKAASSGTVTQSGEDSANENQQKSVAKRRKRAHTVSENVKLKRAKESSGGSSSKIKAAGKGSKNKEVEEVTLFEVLSMDKRAKQTVIDDWIEAYTRDKDSSLLDLISFFVQCSGCKGVVTAEMCQNKAGDEVKSKMIEKSDEVAGLQYKKFLVFPWILTVTWPLDADSGEYPLMQSGPYSRWFQSELSEFLSILVSQCQHTVIFDSYLMNALISLFSELSNSYMRAFRHTFTLAAVKLLSSLMDVALSLSVGIENSQKLYNVQRTKPVRQRSTYQQQKLKKNITRLQGKRAEVESMMDTIFKAVFLKRYRDVLPEIRSICMEELGLWMKLYSSLFLNDSYLKYTGWMMHDKTADVRLKCVLSLQRLYGDPLLLPQLDLFTSRFKGRIMSMTLDKDMEVAVQTMKLLVLMSKSSDDVLTPEDHNHLLQFVYCSQRPLASAAGELLYSRILIAGAPKSQENMDEEKALEQQTFARLRALLQFYQDAKVHQHVIYLVDSLWDCGGALLKDWPAMTSALLQEPSSHNPGFTSVEQVVLVEILVASVRQAAEGPALAGRSGSKKVLTIRERKCQTEDSLKLTQHFLVVLPRLFSKYSCSCEIVSSLIRIPQYFLSEGSEEENSKLVCSLLAEMAAILDLHLGPAVLEAAARTYLSLCGERTPWSEQAGAARDSLVQSWADHMKELLQVSLPTSSSPADKETINDIITTLKKLRAFNSCHDLSRWGLFDLLSPLLSEDSSWGGAPAEVVEELLRCSSFSLLWVLSKSGESLTSRENAVTQRFQLRLFCEWSHRCLTYNDARVRHQAFLGVCDVLTAQSFQLRVWDPTGFNPLVYTPSPKLQRALLTFTCSHVFVGHDCHSQNFAGEKAEEEKLEDLHTRRNLLAAYCKLIVHGVLEMSMAAEVFSYYVKYTNSFGDVIKEMLSRMRQVNKIASACTLALCLQQLFVRLKQEQQQSDGCSSSSSSSGSGAHAGVQTFTSIKELARRFALTFGDPVKSRECVVMIHRNGIEFVFQDFCRSLDTPTPPYLSYLGILSEFSSKLLKPDKKTVFSYLQKLTGEHVVDLGEECWKPLIHYRASILAIADAGEAGSHASSDKRTLVLAKQRHEGNKTPCYLSPVDSEIIKDPRPSISLRRQVEMSLERPARTRNADGSGCSDDGSVEVEL